MDEVDESAAMIIAKPFVLRAIIWSWQIMAWTLGVIGILGGLAVVVGPTNAHGGVTLRFMAEFGSLNVIVALVMILGGLMTFGSFIDQWVETVAHFVLGITYGWFGFVVIWIIFILQQDASLTAVTWALGLMAVHFIAAGARVFIWQFMRKIEGRVDG